MMRIMRQRRRRWERRSKLCDYYVFTVIDQFIEKTFLVLAICPEEQARLMFELAVKEAQEYANFSANNFGAFVSKLSRVECMEVKPDCLFPITEKKRSRSDEEATR